MARNVEPERLKDLIRLMGGLQKSQEQLLTLVQSKIDAMKRADMPAMRELGEKERAVAKRLYERDGFRRQLMDALGKDMGFPAGSGRDLSVSQIAVRLPVPARARLFDAAAGLRNVVSRVAQANRIAGVISREIVNHLGCVFAAVRPAGGQPVGYSGEGAPVAASGTRIFETVG